MRITLVSQVRSAYLSLILYNIPCKPPLFDDLIHLPLFSLFNLIQRDIKMTPSNVSKPKLTSWTGSRSGWRIFRQITCRINCQAGKVHYKCPYNALESFPPSQQLISFHSYAITSMPAPKRSGKSTTAKNHSHHIASWSLEAIKIAINTPVFIGTNR